MPVSATASTRSRRSLAQRASQRGFSLMEVMVALVVTTIGLLGLAKMESLALSSTGVASARSLAAIEASSMAAAMHANPGYWADGGMTQPSIVISNAVNPYSTAASCYDVPGASSCGPAAMAAYDLQQWAVALNNVLPGYVATIACSPSVSNVPVTCTITLQWAENAVASNAQQTQAQMSSLTTPTYVLYVQP
jgi:type IV pilus assembly protein PilV